MVIRTGPAFLVHRVVRCADGVMIARGDNCAQDDAPVPLARVLGRVQEIERDGRVLSLADFDTGPSRAGRLRLQGKRGVAKLLGLSPRRSP